MKIKTKQNPIWTVYETLFFFFITGVEFTLKRITGAEDCKSRHCVVIKKSCSHDAPGDPWMLLLHLGELLLELLM